MKKKSKKSKFKQQKKNVASNQLPKYLKIDGVEYFTPVRLRSLRHKGQILSNAVKVAVYAAFIKNKRKKTLKYVVDLLYNIRDEYCNNAGTYKPEDNSLEAIIFSLLRFESDYYIRNEILNKIESIHAQHPEIKTYKWQCFNCDKYGFFNYGETLMLSETELSYLWEARDMYLQTVDDGSMQFEVFFAYEGLTKFVFVDFNEIGVIGADLISFLQCLKYVKYGTK